MIPFVEDILRAYTEATHGWGWALLLLLVVGMMYLKTRNFMPPLIILAFGSSLLGAILPGVVGAFGFILAALSFSVIIYKIFFRD